ncbi:BMP family ABC transporter substrate-binding protein [soil metagenome]
MAGLTRLNASLNRRRLIVASGGAALAAAVLGKGAYVAAQDSDVIATLVTDTAGIGDQNFNDLANAGGVQAAEDFGIDWRVLESQTQADYVTNLTLALEQGQLTVPNGFLLIDAVAEVAPQFPDKFIVFIDAVDENPHVQSVVFKEHEGAFLGGILSALVTQTGVLGIVGGIRVPPVERYEVGFIAGARTINPDIEILISYADSFEDPTLGQDLTLAQFNNGADIVLPIAGRTGVGSFDAANERGEGVWILAGDTDQSHLGPEAQLAYIKKGVDEAVYQGCEQVANDTFEAGIRDLGLTEAGMDLLGFHASVDQGTLDIVEAYKQAIIDGTVAVPANDAELEAFEPTVLEGSATPEATPAS